jgi:putative transposase
MKKNTFTESLILKILQEYESGIPTSDLSRKYGFHKSTLYDWKKKYSGMNGSDLHKLKELQRENEQLKKMFANLSLENNALKDLIEKKL